MNHWLKQIKRATEEIEVEKDRVKAIVNSVTVGIDAGHQLAMATNWKTPSDDEMMKSILVHIKLDETKKLLNLGQKSISDEELGKPEMDPTSQSHKSVIRKKRIHQISLMSLDDIDSIAGLVGRNGTFMTKLKILKAGIRKVAGESSFSEPTKKVLEDKTYSFDDEGDKVRQKLSLLLSELANMIFSFIEVDLADREENRMTDRVCRRALGYVTPRDKRTLVEMIKCGLEHDRSAKLLLGRTATLLERELRRQELNHQIMIRSNDDVPFAESIIRAQKAFLTIELDCTRKFSYNGM